jgi:AraC-like DNA-binding protein
VEFNRRALYRQDDKIYAGSLNGLYTLRINDIPKLIEDYKYHPEKDSLPNSFRGIVALLVVLVIILAALTIRFRRKLKDAETRIENSVPVPQEAVTREKIEEFVTHHLAHSSIKSIQENFGLNTTQLYAILKPDRPGSIIQKIRLARVKEMREQGKTIQEISNATGLSVSYLRKVKS